MLGTQFTIYDGGEPSKTRQGLLGDKAVGRQEIAGVLYDTNVLGFKGPRRMTGEVRWGEVSIPFRLLVRNTPIKLILKLFPVSCF